MDQLHDQVRSTQEALLSKNKQKLVSRKKAFVVSNFHRNPLAILAVRGGRGFFLSINPVSWGTYSMDVPYLDVGLAG